MKILLLEDNSRRIQKIIQLAKNLFPNVYVNQVFDAENALKSLRHEQYDVFIVDLFVPESLAEEISTNAGVDLIDHVFQTNENIFHPKGMIVLSSNLDHENYSSYLAQYPVALIDGNKDEEWQTLLINNLNYYMNRCNNIDVAIITAVDVEFNAIYDSTWQKDKDVGTIKFYRKTFKNNEGKLIHTILFQLEDKGMVSPGIGICTLLKHYRPKNIIMIGITAGNPDKTKFGDVIVATQSYDYSYGAIKEIDGNVEFETDLVLEKASDDLISIFREYSKNNRIQQEIRNRVNMLDEYKEDIEIKLGSIATGPAVIKSKYFTEKYIRPQNRNYLGIDMETYSVYYSCKRLDNQLNYISIKSVCDHANSEKKDTHQKYCSKLTAELTKYYIENDL